MQRLILSLLAILILPLSTIYADLSPRIIIPPEPKDSPVPLVMAGVAITFGVVILGVWLAKKRRSQDSQDQ
jgi:hypothetical protein